MKRAHDKKYFYWGLTAFCVIAASILFFFALYRLDGIARFFGTLLGALSPFIYGFIMAYLLNPVYNRLYGVLIRLLRPHMKKEEKAVGAAKALATALSILLLLFVAVALVWLVLPQVINSVIGLVDSDILPNSIQKINRWMDQTFEASPDFERAVNAVYTKSITRLTEWLETDMLPQLTNLMAALMSTINVVKNLFIGLIVAVYLLAGKRTYTAQAKKVLYSFLSVRRANLVLENLRFTNRMFGGFFNGKLLDSLIIGLLCFFGMMILDMPYAMLISVIIGVTNIIPFFGPFIGAIPSALLILLIDPMKMIYFVIFILVLQQFDGNILGPRILGGTTGLSGFWVMFALLTAGGLFGLVGMIVGVPLFGVLYSLAASFIDRRLTGRGLPAETQAYDALSGFDAETKERIPYGQE